MGKRSLVTAGAAMRANALWSAGDRRPGVESCDHQAHESPDKLGMCANGGHADVVPDTGFHSQFAIFDVELDQRLGVLRNKGNRYDNGAFAVRAGAPHLCVGGGPDPLEWADTALVADLRVEALRRQLG